MSCDDKHLKTLKLFADSNYQKYVNQKEDYIELDEEMEKKLKFTRIVHMAKMATCVEYGDFLEEFSIDNEGDLMKLIEDFLANGL